MVDTSKFGKTKGTAVVTKPDGTKLFIKDSKIVKEISPEGKQRVRVQVAPLGTGARKRGVPAGEFVKDLPGVALQEKQRRQERIAIDKAKKEQQAQQKREKARKQAETQRKILQTQSLRQSLLTGKVPSITETPTFILKSFIPQRQQELKTTITRLDKSPYSSSVKKELKLLAASYDPKIQRKKTIPKVNVQGNFVEYRTLGEKKFYEKLDKVWGRDKRLKGKFEDVTKSLKLNVKDSDKWYIRALKGVGTAGVGILFTGEFLANAVDISILQGKAMFSTDVIKEANKRVTRSTLKAVPRSVGESFDPRKPENWANIALAIYGVKATVKTIRTGRAVKTTLKNPEVVKKAVIKQKKTLSSVKKTVRQSIKKGLNVKKNQRLLKDALKSEKLLDSTFEIFKKIGKGKKLSKKDAITLDKVLRNAKRSKVKPVDIVKQSLVRARKLSIKEKIVSKVKSLKPSKKTKTKSKFLVKERKLSLKEKSLNRIKSIFKSKKKFKETSNFLILEKSKIKALKQKAIKISKNNPVYRRLSNYEQRVSKTLSNIEKINKKKPEITIKVADNLNNQLNNIKREIKTKKIKAAIKKEIDKRQVARKAKEFRKEIEGKQIKAKRTLSKKEIADIRREGRKLNKLIDNGVIKSNAELSKAIKPLVRGKLKPVFKESYVKALRKEALKGEIAKRKFTRDIKTQLKEQSGLRSKAKRTLSKKEIQAAKQLVRKKLVKSSSQTPSKAFNVVFREQPIVKGLKVETQIKSVAVRNKAPTNIVIKKNNVIVRAKKTRGNTYTVKDVVGKVSSDSDGGVTIGTATKQQVILKTLETVKKSVSTQKALVSQANKLKSSESIKMLPRRTISEIKEYNRLLRLAERQTISKQQTILSSTKFEKLSQKYKNVVSKGDFKGVKVIGLPKRITLAGLASSLGLKDKQKQKVAVRQKPKTATKPRLAVATVQRLSIQKRNILSNLQKPIVAIDEKVAQQQLLRRLNVLERISKTKKPRKLKLKRRSSPKEKKDINEFVKSAPKVYRPSFAAIILGITAYKVPTSITGLNIRPIIIKKR